MCVYGEGDKKTRVKVFKSKSWRLSGNQGLNATTTKPQGNDEQICECVCQQSDGGRDAFLQSNILRSISCINASDSTLQICEYLIFPRILDKIFYGFH